jgi:hypothetical protein
LAEQDASGGEEKDNEHGEGQATRYDSDKVDDTVDH